MIASIVAMDQKERESAEIAKKTAAFLCQGREVSEIPFGVGHNTCDTFRDFQSKLAKMDAANKVAKEAGVIPVYPLQKVLC
jgi:hypothetical protein